MGGVECESVGWEVWNVRVCGVECEGFAWEGSEVGMWRG